MQLLPLASSNVSARSLVCFDWVTCLSLKQSLWPEGWSDWAGLEGGLGSVPQGLRVGQGWLPIMEQTVARKAEHPTSITSHHVRNIEPGAGIAGLKENR